MTEYPNDEKIKSLIDRIALNVAANGPNLANHILTKEQGNPMFSFLIPGGKYNDYFEYQKDIAKKQQQPQDNFQQPPLHFQHRQPTPQQPQPVDPLKPRIDIEAIKNKIAVLKDQVAESEKNVASQKHVLSNAVDAQLEQLYAAQERENIGRFVSECGLNIAGLNEILEKNSFSTEVVSKGKHWIVDYCITDKQKEVAFLYMLFRTKTCSLDSPIRLLIVYIADELAAFSFRKMPALCSIIARYIHKFFAYATESRIPNVKEKLTKVLNFWEKDKYFDEKCLQRCRDPQQTLTTERSMEIGDKTSIKNRLEQENRIKIANYEKQHAEYACHINSQIVALEATIENENRRILSLTTPKEIVPSLPYFLLPAAVMVAQVKPEDFNYKPLNTKEIRLPNMFPPTEKLTSQITRFYSIMPESSLDEQGWERDGLKHHFDVKNAAKKAMEEVLIAQGKKLEDVFTNRYRSPSPNSEALRKTRFDVKPKEEQPKNPFHFNYDNPSPSKETPEMKSMPSSVEQNHDERFSDFSRGGFGSSNTSFNNKPNEAPMFGKPISFSFGSHQR